MRRMPTWLKGTTLTLLITSILIPLLDRTVLEPRGLTFRAHVDRCAIIFLTLAVLLLLIWTGVLLWHRPAEGPHRCAAVVSIALLCLLAGGVAQFAIRLTIPYERVIERDGQHIVEESPPLDSGSNYYSCRGPLLRGAELLEGSYYLNIHENGKDT